MSWTKYTRNEMLVAEETVSLSNASTAYSSEVNFVQGDKNLNKYVAFYFKASAVGGTDTNCHLYGAYSSGGTKVLLKSDIITNLTDTTATVGLLDINAYPAPYYYLGFESQGDDSSNTMAAKISIR